MQLPKTVDMVRLGWQTRDQLLWHTRACINLVSQGAPHLLLGTLLRCRMHATPHPLALQGPYPMLCTLLIKQ